jgi:hypothetical protein
MLRTLLRRERLVLESFQLRRDVALRILERLPATVIVGYPGRVRIGDLDIEAMDAIEFDLEIGNAGTLAFTRFERQQKFAAIRVDCAQLVQFGIETRCDDATVTNLRRRFGRNGAGERRRPLRIDVEIGIERGEKRRAAGCNCHGDCAAQCRQAQQRVAQAGQIARPRRQKGDATGDALGVDRACKLARKFASRPGLLVPRRDGCMTCGSRVLRAQRMCQPMPQQPAAGSGDTGVEQ